MPTLLLSIIDTLIHWDINASLFINGLHCNYLDNFMMIFSGRWIWVPLYVSLLVVMLRNYPLKVNICCIIAAVVLITVIDQTTASLLRPILCRPRPANLDSPIAPLVHVVDNYRGGHYGFPSSHAANCWGAAFFVMYVFRRNILTFIFCLWAFIVCWTRVYLGVHYVGDILFGTAIGFITASIIYYIFQKGLHKTSESFKPHLGEPKFFTPVVVFCSETALIFILAFFTRFYF